MKRSMICLMTLFLSSAFIPTQTKAVSDPISTPFPPTNPAEAAKVEVLTNRLNEINLMDKSDLSRSDKRALRKEVRSTKKELKEINGGVYLSVGAIILIILLLIILL